MRLLGESEYCITHKIIMHYTDYEFMTLQSQQFYRVETYELVIKLFAIKRNGCIDLLYILRKLILMKSYVGFLNFLIILSILSTSKFELTVVYFNLLFYPSSSNS